MYLANYDQEGKILGFYIQGMHANIPEPTLEITEEQHQEYFNNGQNYKVIDGEFMYVEPEPQATQIVTPVIDQNIADMYEVMFDMAARLEKLEGGAV